MRAFECVYACKDICTYRGRCAQLGNACAHYTNTRVAHMYTQHVYIHTCIYVHPFIHRTCRYTFTHAQYDSVSMRIHVHVVRMYARTVAIVDPKRNDSFALYVVRGAISVTA